MQKKTQINKSKFRISSLVFFKEKNHRSYNMRQPIDLVKRQLLFWCQQKSQVHTTVAVVADEVTLVASLLRFSWVRTHQMVLWCKMHCKASGECHDKDICVPLWWVWQLINCTPPNWFLRTLALFNSETSTEMAISDGEREEEWASHPYCCWSSGLVVSLCSPLVGVYFKESRKPKQTTITSFDRHVTETT